MKEGEDIGMALGWFGRGKAFVANAMVGESALSSLEDASCLR